MSLRCKRQENVWSVIKKKLPQNLKSRINKNLTLKKYDKQINVQIKEKFKKH